MILNTLHLNLNGKYSLTSLVYKKSLKAFYLLVFETAFYKTGVERVFKP